MNEWVKVLADYGLSGVLVVCIVYLVKALSNKDVRSSNHNSKSDKIIDQNIEIDKKIDRVETCLEYISENLKALTSELKGYTKEMSTLNSSLNMLISLMRENNERRNS